LFACTGEILRVWRVVTAAKSADRVALSASKVSEGWAATASRQTLELAVNAVLAKSRLKAPGSGKMSDEKDVSPNQIRPDISAIRRLLNLAPRRSDFPFLSSAL